jgi:hypothetical protein
MWRCGGRSRFGGRVRVALFDRAGCEPELALGDVGPDERGCFLPLAVVQGGLDGSGDRRKAAGDVVPGAGVQAPSVQGLAAVVVVGEAGGGVELAGQVVQGGGEVGGSVLAEPSGQAGPG